MACPGGLVDEEEQTGSQTAGSALSGRVRPGTRPRWEHVSTRPDRFRRGSEYGEAGEASTSRYDWTPQRKSLLRNARTCWQDWARSPSPPVRLALPTDHPKYLVSTPWPCPDIHMLFLPGATSGRVPPAARAGSPAEGVMNPYPPAKQGGVPVGPRQYFVLRSEKYVSSVLLPEAEQN